MQISSRRPGYRRRTIESAGWGSGGGGWWKVIAKVVQSYRADHYPVSDIAPHHLAAGLHSSPSRLGLIMVAIKHNSGYNRSGRGYRYNATLDTLLCFLDHLSLMLRTIDIYANIFLNGTKTNYLDNSNSLGCCCYLAVYHQFVSTPTKWVIWWDGGWWGLITLHWTNIRTICTVHNHHSPICNSSTIKMWYFRYLIWEI